LIYLAGSTAVRLMTGLVALKYLAFAFGPASFGLLTQIMGVAAIFYMFAGGAIGWGLIRNIAAARFPHDRERWMSAACSINFASSIAFAAIALMLWLFDNGAIFRAPGYGWVYLGIAVAVPIVGFGNLILAYYSGVGDVRTFATINVAANVAALMLVIGLGLGFGLAGAVAGLALSPGTLGVIALWSLCRTKQGYAMLRVSWDVKALRDLLSYAAVLAASAAAIPAAQLLIRADLGERLGWDVVGYWQAVARLSDAYMTFIGVAFVNYLLPLLARRPDETASETTPLRVLWRFDSALLPAFMVMCGAIYAFRNILLTAIFSGQFLPASGFFLPQLAGDVLRVAGLSLSYYFIAQGRLAIASWSEVGRGVALYVFYLMFAVPYGAAAPLYAHVATYAVFLAVMLGLLQLPGAAPHSRDLPPPPPPPPPPNLD
jgi:PST family polysaccharide transporter